MDVGNEHATGKLLRVRLGTPDMRGSGKTELSLIAAVNETVKEAITVSASIGLIAINASLIAGRAGNRAAGFCVVATELRRFSDGMAADMGRWSRLIEDLVDVTARGHRQAHLLYKLQDTVRRSAQAQAALGDACNHARLVLNEITLQTSAQVKALLDLIRRSEKQHLTGEMIARSAMIEAAYGGNMQAVLRQIADSIGESMVRFSEYSTHIEQQMRRAVA